MANQLQTVCNEDLKQLLASWNLESISTHLIAEDITVEILKVIKITHIPLLLSKFSLGTQIRFEHCLEKWRTKIGKPLKQYLSVERNPTKQEKILENGQCSDSFEKSILEKFAEVNQPIDIKEILSKCLPDGPELLKSYGKNHTFSSPERSHLINIIVDYYLQNDLPFNIYTSFDLENAILSTFPNEKIEMYRNEKQSKIHSKYLSAKAVYSKQKSINKEEESTEEIKIFTIEEKSNQNKSTQSIENQQNYSFLIDVDDYEEQIILNEAPTEILLQSLYKGCRKFIKFYEPFLYKDYFLTACTLFNIANKNDVYVAVNDCEVNANDFKNIVLQYYKLPTFTVEVKEKVLPFIVTKIEDFEISQPETISNCQANSFTPVKTYEKKFAHKKSSIQIINNYLPDVNDIRNIPALLPIVKMSDDGKRLENKHRATIAKAIIDECLNYQPERVLKRQDFFTLTQNLIQAFPREVASTYFIPPQPNVHARGKLWNAYNNKRKILSSAGVLDKRHHGNMKRNRQSDDDSNRTYDKRIFVADFAKENYDFSFHSANDWDTTKRKWSETHHERREKLLRKILSPHDYMEKYSILKSDRGFELMEIDVNILHPSVLDISNWLSFYEIIVDRTRNQRKEPVPKLLECIDNSTDERYRASLALLLIPYIFPYNAKRFDNATKFDIQKRFIKEYTSLEDLEFDSESEEMQLRFVHDEQQITYAEFNICGTLFKCSDLWQALNSVFHYAIALNLEYPKLCLYVWQFIQSAIFQIEIKDGLQPNVEVMLNDLCMS